MACVVFSCVTKVARLYLTMIDVLAMSPPVCARAVTNVQWLRQIKVVPGGLSVWLCPCRLVIRVLRESCKLCEAVMSKLLPLRNSTIWSVWSRQRGDGRPRIRQFGRKTVDVAIAKWPNLVGYLMRMLFHSIISRKKWLLRLDAWCGNSCGTETSCRLNVCPPTSYPKSR